MSLGKRRPKPNRAQLRPAHPPDIRQNRSAKQRARLARLGVVAVAVLATAAIVHGSGPPFTYRLGQRPTRELRVRVPSFQIKNQRKTNADLQSAVARVAPLMNNDPAPIRELAHRLGDLADAVATAADRDALPEGVLAAWPLDAATFFELKAATASPERLEDLHKQIDAAFVPLVRDGVVGPDTLPRHEDASTALQVRVAGGTPVTVPLDRVKSERIAKPDGPVAKDFTSAFKPPALGRRLFALVAEKLTGTPTLTYDEPATIAARKVARDAVKDVYDTYERGDLLIDQDQEIEEEQLTLLKMEHDKANAALSAGARFRRAASLIVMVGALFALIGYYVHHHMPEVCRSLSRTTVLCGLVAAAMGMVRLLDLQPGDAELIPVALAAMVLAIAYTSQFALMVTFALCLLTSLALGSGLGPFLVMMGGTAAGVLLLGEVRTRTKPIQVGAAAALGYFVLTWATGLWQEQPVSLIASDSAWRAGWGLMTGFFLGGILPFVENAFGIVTGISLLELGDITHPLLQELVRRAPGTHNHSVTVGSISEAAAERIGANALLVRIGAYFHDIGKMLKPHYFVENQATGAANRHANLAPAMSTLIIIGHVKDGVDLGRQHHLPEPIIDLIEQHHGTTLVEYFYREATRRCDGDPHAATVQESAFRYPGPKPQTKEAGILMVADAVESASRTLSEPTPARIEGLVASLVEKRLDDGQFDECGLTLREIAEIRDSLIKSLIGIYHGRVKYPEQRTA
jgi:putative nucleotidyltransferase with HDIG domain